MMFYIFMIIAFMCGFGLRMNGDAFGSTLMTVSFICVIVGAALQGLVHQAD